MSGHPVKRPGNPADIKRAGAQARVVAFPAGPGSHEPVQLLIGTAPPLRGLLLEDAQRPELALAHDDLLDRGGAEPASTEQIHEAGGPST